MHDGIVEHLRNLSVAIIWEGGYFQNPAYQDQVTQTIDAEYTVMHELGPDTGSASRTCTPHTLFHARAKWRPSGV